MKRLLLALCLSAPPLLTAGCGDARAHEPATLVFAAASLTDAFAALERAFEDAHPEHEVDVHCAGTPRLVAQARQGAAVDVFASADLHNLRKVTSAEARVFARNRLALVVARGNPHGIARLSDLAHEELLVALCGPEVPAGRYARLALARAGVSVATVSDEPSVKAIVAKVALGELDAGIVYASDGTDAVRLLALDPAHDVVAEYPLAVLGEGAGARAFATFVLSAEGRRILVAHGFEAP